MTKFAYFISMRDIIISHLMEYSDCGEFNQALKWSCRRKTEMLLARETSMCTIGDHWPRPSSLQQLLMLVITWWRPRSRRQSSSALCRWMWRRAWIRRGTSVARHPSTRLSD